MIGIEAVLLVAAHRAADLEPVEARQHQVEKQQIRRRLPDRGSDVAPRRHEVGVEAGSLQIVREQARDVGVVLGDQDPAHGQRSIRRLAARL